MIFNVNPDPDYPTASAGGFAQYTSRPYYNAMQQQQQYYYNGQSLTPQMPDSRRYDNPAQPTMSMPNQTFGFNQVPDVSRRNDMAPVQNPWAIQPVAQQAPTMPTMPNPEIPQPIPYPSDVASLYQCHPSFDIKQGVWGDQPIANPVMPPTVNWGAPNVTPTNVPQYGYMNSPAMQYPQIQQPINLDWSETAKQIWNK